MALEKHKALNTLIDFYRELDDKGFLIYGTCLGANREDGFIKHDLDIDVGIMRADFKLDMISRLINEGFDLIRVYGMLEFGFELSFRREGVKVDLMIFYPTEEGAFNCLWDNGGVNGISDAIVHYYPWKCLDMEELNIMGVPFVGFGEEYLERVYGLSWREPVEKWDWRKDHQCIDDNLKIKLIEKYGK